ncbi:DUF1127 domain-containing protein [Yoonia sp. SS1-5]|uniref:DUF1127 domain-containing protein n=1 Tax=Yoonia rhodophyticola TaxID=3137370 RepID=A0AAN0MG90_9RHOB
MTHTDCISAAPAQNRRSVGLLKRLGHYFAVRGQRNGLRKLPPHLLRDIGLTDAEARREVAKPFWDVRETWRD